MQIIEDPNKIFEKKKHVSFSSGLSDSPEILDDGRSIKYEKISLSDLATVRAVREPR